MCVCVCVHCCVCVCSLCVCLHLGWVNAEHESRVWVMAVCHVTFTCFQTHLHSLLACCRRFWMSRASRLCVSCSVRYWSSAWSRGWCSRSTSRCPRSDPTVSAPSLRRPTTTTGTASRTSCPTTTRVWSWCPPKRTTRATSTPRTSG